MLFVFSPFTPPFSVSTGRPSPPLLILPSASSTACRLPASSEVGGFTTHHCLLVNARSLSLGMRKVFIMKSRRRGKPLLPPKRKPSVSPASTASPYLSSPTRPSLRRTQTAKEWAGGTTAGCAAVLCCAPMVVAEFVVLIVYKVPSGLCRRVVRKRRMIKRVKTRKEMGLVYCGFPTDNKEYVGLVDQTVFDIDAFEDDDEMIDMNKQMWEQFNNGGFWRTPSQRDEEEEEEEII